jgi:poly(A) polymerase
LKAADFMARGVEKGPRLGALMRAAEAVWIKGGFPLDREALARIVDEAWATTR